MDSKTTIRKCPVDRDRLETILKHPDTVAKNAWMLFVAYFWDGFKSECYHMQYEDEDPELVPDYSEYDINGMSIEKETFDIMLNSAADDYLEAMHNRMTVRIADKPFRVPSNENVTKEILVHDIFQFKVRNPDSHRPYLSIQKSDIYEIDDTEQKDPAEEKRDSRLFFHKIVLLVETTDDGWDILTDMEAAAYEWAFVMYKYEDELVKDMANEVNKAFQKIEEEIGFDNAYCITDCWISDFKSAVVSIDTQFSAEKIRSWNAANKQKSLVDDIDAKKANDYWYDKCKTFK